jgi:polyhydroxyalkanoate synthesis regulator phasin
METTEKEVPTVEVPEQEVSAPDIQLEGVESFRSIVEKFSNKLSPLVKEGYMSQTVATRILDDFSYNAFQQIVKVEYR